MNSKYFKKNHTQCCCCSIRMMFSFATFLFTPENQFEMNKKQKQFKKTNKKHILRTRRTSSFIVVATSINAIIIVISRRTAIGQIVIVQLHTRLALS